MRIRHRLAAVALCALLSQPCHADNQAMAADYCEGLGLVVSSVVMDTSSFCANSYPGAGQTQHNVEPTPANSEAQTYSDFYLGQTSGASSTDPTFTGFAGHHGAYWALDGGDYLSHTAGASPTTFFADMHREDTSQAWGAWIAFRFTQNDATQNLLGISNAANVAGIQFQTTSTESLIFRRADGGSVNTLNTIFGNSSLVNGVDYIFFFSYTNATRAWTASLYSSGVSVATASGTAASVAGATTSSTGTMTAFSSNKSGTALANGSRGYEAGFTNAALSAGDITATCAGPSSPRPASRGWQTRRWTPGHHAGAGHDC
jgi:hypothetical protein